MRIRTIKPEFFRHEELFDVEQETGLPIRVAFTGLWCVADREGRFEWRPRSLKSQILPFDNCDFSRVLDALTTRGFVVRYASNGSEFGVIPTFSRHQVINNRERPSELPPPDETTIKAGLTRAPRVNDACPTPLCNAQAEGNKEQGTRNKEGNKKKKASPPSSRRVPDLDTILVDFPKLNTPNFKAAWKEKETHRKERGDKPYTPTGLKRLFSQMESWGAETAIEGINESIANDWRGVFTPKKGTTYGNNRANRDKGTANEHIDTTGLNDLFRKVDW